MEHLRITAQRTNCTYAEPMPLAYYYEETGPIGFSAQVPLAVYGKGGRSGTVGYQYPCGADGLCSGCGHLVEFTFSMDVLTRRAVSAPSKVSSVVVVFEKHQQERRHALGT